MVWLSEEQSVVSVCALTCRGVAARRTNAPSIMPRPIVRGTSDPFRQGTKSQYTYEHLSHRGPSSISFRECQRLAPVNQTTVKIGQPWRGHKEQSPNCHFSGQKLGCKYPRTSIWDSRTSAARVQREAGNAFARFARRRLLGIGLQSQTVRGMVRGGCWGQRLKRPLESTWKVVAERAFRSQCPDWAAVWQFHDRLSARF